MWCSNIAPSAGASPFLRVAAAWLPRLRPRAMLVGHGISDNQAVLGSSYRINSFSPWPLYTIWSGFARNKMLKSPHNLDPWYAKQGEAPDQAWPDWGTPHPQLLSTRATRHPLDHPGSGLLLPPPTLLTWRRQDPARPANSCRGRGPAALRGLGRAKLTRELTRDLSQGTPPTHTLPLPINPAPLVGQRCALQVLQQAAQLHADVGAGEAAALARRLLRLLAVGRGGTCRGGLHGRQGPAEPGACRASNPPR
jgi:hypothetical protein